MAAVPPFPQQAELDRLTVELGAAAVHKASMQTAQQAYRGVEQSAWSVYASDLRLADQTREIARAQALADYHVALHTRLASEAADQALSSGTTPDQHAAAVAAAQSAWTQMHAGAFVAYVTASAAAETVYDAALTVAGSLKSAASADAYDQYETADESAWAAWRTSALQADLAWSEQGQTIAQAFSDAKLSADAGLRTDLFAAEGAFALSLAGTEQTFRSGNLLASTDPEYVSWSTYQSNRSSVLSNHTAAVTGVESVWSGSVAGAERTHRLDTATADKTWELAWAAAEQSQSLSLADAAHVRETALLAAESVYRQSASAARADRSDALAVAEAGYQDGVYQALVAAWTELNTQLALPWTAFKQSEAEAQAAAWTAVRGDWLQFQSDLTAVETAYAATSDAAYATWLTAVQTAMHQQALVVAGAEYALSTGLANAEHTARLGHADVLELFHTSQTDATGYTADLTAVRDTLKTAAGQTRLDYVALLGSEHVAAQTTMAQADATYRHARAAADQSRDDQYSTLWGTFITQHAQAVAAQMDADFAAASPWAEHAASVASAQATYTAAQTAAQTAFDTAFNQAERDYRETLATAGATLLTARAESAATAAYTKQQDQEAAFTWSSAVQAPEMLKFADPDAPAQPDYRLTSETDLEGEPIDWVFQAWDQLNMLLMGVQPPPDPNNPDAGPQPYWAAEPTLPDPTDPYHKEPYSLSSALAHIGRSVDQFLRDTLSTFWSPWLSSWLYPGNVQERPLPFARPAAEAAHFSVKDEVT